MLLRRVIEHFRKQEWTAIAIDFLIVVVGVFIGVQVNGWWESRSDARREAAYLAALKGDFAEIVAELDNDAAEYAKIAAEMSFLLEQSRKGAPDASIEALNAAAKLLTRMEGTPIASGTYANLIGSGDLSLVRSQKIKDTLSSFYSQSKVIELVGVTHEMQLVNIFQPYIIAHLDYPGMLSSTRGVEPAGAFNPDLILTALPAQEFRNVVAVKWDIVTDIRGLIEGSLTSAREVQSLLDEE
ncbi:MAG: hypothetical protein WD076_08175, partial [Parvularculaceae bacterium]